MFYMIKHREFMPNCRSGLYPYKWVHVATLREQMPETKEDFTSFIYWSFVDSGKWPQGKYMVQKHTGKFKTLFTLDITPHKASEADFLLQQRGVYQGVSPNICGETRSPFSF